MSGEELLQALKDNKVWVLSTRADGKPFRRITHLFGEACVRYDDAVGSLYLSHEGKGLILYPGNMGKRGLEYGQVWGLLKRRK